MSNPYTIKNLIAQTNQDEETIRTLLIDLRDDADTCQMITKAQYEAVLQALTAETNTSLALSSATNEQDQQDQITIINTANELFERNLTMTFQADFIGFAQALQARNQVLESIQAEADKQLAKNLHDNTLLRFETYHEVIESMEEHIPSDVEIGVPDLAVFQGGLLSVTAKLSKKLVR